MCSIIGSFSKDKFKELVQLNQSRGSFSYSFLVFNPNNLTITSLEQGFGEFPLDIVDGADDGMYLLGHTQAPTGGLVEDFDRIHPARTNDHNDGFLFHNGIIKQKDIERLQDEHSTDIGWDSKLMMLDIQQKGLMLSLNTIDGSFACVYSEPGMVSIFRSAAGTLFVDDKLNISSTKFDDSERIDKDTVYLIDFSNKLIENEFKFKSKSSPYFY